MEFVKLLPPENAKPLPVAKVLRRLRDQFKVVEADKSQGWDHVADMIAATLRYSDDIPEREQQLAWLESVQEDAVYVAFGDTPDAVASCCVMPGAELYFATPDEIHGPLRPLIDRCATALGYELVEG
jgi:hypothetical protein